MACISKDISEKSDNSHFCVIVRSLLVAQNKASRKFEKLKTPMVKVMAKVATIKMIAERGDFDVDDLIGKIDVFINKNKK